jgi:hypothetical protein
VVTFDLLGLPAVSVVLQQLTLWLPNLIVALLVVVLGGLAANALARVVRGASVEAGFTNPDVLAAVARVVVWAFAVVVAVNQLGIATGLINTLLIGVVGALALASGLAFGLGGWDRAARILDNLGRRSGPPGPAWSPRCGLPTPVVAAVALGRALRRDRRRGPAGAGSAASRSRP